MTLPLLSPPTLLVGCGGSGLVTITTDYPDYLPFRTFATDAAARLELTTAFLNRGWPDNDAVLQEMFALRHEQANILGYQTWPDFDTDVKMIGSSPWAQRCKASSLLSSLQSRSPDPPEVLEAKR